jgi:hypothetical protein
MTEEDKPGSNLLEPSISESDMDENAKILDSAVKGLDKI